MAWTTVEFRHVEVTSSRTDRYTIVSGLKRAIGYGYTSRSLDMEAICVGTLVWSH